ncbi:hypothetical protein M8C21_003953 [Ambrosia artemisiifolia]|uniref:Uncharacterized protein n=1 Tax=Ambrosia artemisiifolia TaxID=4212 RepID=A0AAD5C9T1_AMBAR|nr:hypothetical protein M8C21_003953 [Ambrosia artemisiifolia]
MLPHLCSGNVRAVPNSVEVSGVHSSLFLSPRFQKLRFLYVLADRWCLVINHQLKNFIILAGEIGCNVMGDLFVDGEGIYKTLARLLFIELMVQDRLMSDVLSDGCSSEGSSHLG